MDEDEPLDYSILKYLFRSSFFSRTFLGKAWSRQYGLSSSLKILYKIDYYFHALQ